MSLNDSDNTENSAIYSLSETEGVGWFQSIYLVSSTQDNYCP